MQGSKKALSILIVSFLLGAGAGLIFLPLENTNTSISLENHLGETNIFDTTDPRVRILYFGFTECPDICPTSLAILAAAFKKTS